MPALNSELQLVLQLLNTYLVLLTAHTKVLPHTRTPIWIVLPHISVHVRTLIWAKYSLILNRLHSELDVHVHVI